eukprot:3444405-Amphidinium_carterae.1
MTARFALSSSHVCTTTDDFVTARCSSSSCREDEGASIATLLAHAHPGHMQLKLSSVLRV